MFRTAEELSAHIAAVRERTDRPFMVYLSRRPFNPALFEVAVQQRVPAISFAHRDPDDLPARAHDAGALFLHMVNTPEQAAATVQRGVDLLIAHGAKARRVRGRHHAVVPQVVNVANGVPVVAAGGIADGRGMAAALVVASDLIPPRAAWHCGRWRGAEVGAGRPSVAFELVDSEASGWPTTGLYFAIG
ncbi:MAG: nitronate monooxygenase [Actinomycetota bacterium]|nr:nitronate monooxygenase [Actinomycetota bacterium]